ncbi:uncharacterized protein LOC143047778 isoform X2 [Mytilus galloprovincialis]|uniref:uncharacterized protein LOC143047778 isoform X2 n=1 Tax=Mytilus galloprovincialis TaxID=29158 RepID=UPI003F7C1EE0
MTVTMSKFHTSPTRHYNGPQDYQNGGLDEGDVSFISGSPAHGYNDENQTGTVFIRISIPELKIQKCLQFELDETVWHAKQRLLTNFPEDLRDSINYGLYMPPMNGRAGKFLDEERFLSEYPLQGPIGFLEFKHKKRVYKLMHVNPRKLKQLHTKSYLKSFLECVKSGNVEKVTKMTNKGLDPNFHDHSTGETPLTIACSIKGGKCREIVLTLVGGGGHLDFRNKKGMTALHKAVLVKNPTAVKVLLDLGLSPNMKDARCLTPLYYGIAHNSDPAITEMLLQERAVIGSQDEQGWYEIHHACKEGLLQHLEHLLFYGADMDVQNAGGNTAIHICAINNQESCLRVLLFRGANKDIQNYQNQSAFQVAVISGNQGIADILHKHKSDDIVQYREVPKYSVRRRDSVASAAMFALSRSRSDPRINLIMAEGRYISPSNSTQSFSHLDNISSPSRDYSTDSPRSMSISSTSSGPGYDSHLSFSENDGIYQRPQSVCLPGFNGSVRSLTHINSIFNRQKMFQSHSTSFIPERPQTMSAAFSTRLGINNARRRLSEVFDHDHGTRNYANNWYNISAEHIPYSTTYYKPNIEKSSMCSSSSDNLKELDVEWNYTNGIKYFDDKIKEVDVILNEKTSPDKESDISSVVSTRWRPYDQYSVKLDNMSSENHEPNQIKQNSQLVTRPRIPRRLSLINEEQYLSLVNKDDSIFICVVAYEAKYPDELSMKKGEIIEVVGTGDNGMWEGRANGQEGFFPYHHVQEVRLRKAGSCGDILRETTLQRNTLASIVHTYSDYAPRTVVLQRGPEGYGFILRGAKSQSTRNGELDFHPTPEFPALQYLDSVDPSSRADRAGLKPGDFILEINGENVVRASHDRVVQVIRNSGDTLAMKVVTVRPQQNPVNWQHMDGTMTLPSRATSSASASKKQAPQPPRRDPRTSLSKEKGRQIAEGLSELGIEEQCTNDNVKQASGEDQLDLALAEFERENLEQHNVSTEQKTASIRAKHASKRVSCVDLSNIEGYDSEKSDHRSPSERIIHKYNTERKQSAMERSQSTPDLSDKKPEPVYATPVVPGSAGVQRRNDGTYVYAVPEDSLSMKSSTSTSERPKGPPPPPPGALGFKRPAPGVPKDEVVVQPANAEVVSINTIGSRTSLYARPEKISTAPQDDFESSFRPGASAKMTDEPKVKSKAHQRNSSLTSTNSGGSRQSDDKHSVSFAEDKVLDNAKTYLQKHPNAKLLVTADVHSNVKKQTGKYEPEPDYDIEEDKVKSKVTVISIGDRKTTDSEMKRYSVRSDIPAGNIPPPPSEPAPSPPTKSVAPSQTTVKSAAPQPAKAGAPLPSAAKSAAPKPPSPKSKTPSPKVEQKIVTQKKEEVKIENIPSAPAAPPMPPAAPPPPPAPPLPPAEPPAPPLPKSVPPALEKTKQNNTTPQGIETNDLLAAVRKRQQRMDIEGPKISALPESKDGPQKDDNQAAIIAAVARRRRMLEEKGDSSVIDAIETKLQKTKKLQSAKLAFSSDNIGKTPEMKPKVAKPVEPKATVNDVKSTMERQPPKVDIKPIKSVAVKGKEPTKIMSTVNGGAVKTPVKLEVKTDTKITDSNKPIITSTPKTENKENSVSSPRGTDYVALAEKARQDYLQKKASQTSLRVTATNNSPKTVSKPADRSKSPAKTIPTSPLIAQSTTNTSKVPIRDQNKNIITTGVPNDRTKVFSSVSQIPNGNVKNVSSKNKDNGVSSLKPTKDIDVIGQNKTSIKDRIASINKAEQSKVNMNGKVSNEKLSVKGVTVESSVTDKSSLPPPPEFGDSVQLEIIPPPMGFDSGSNYSDISRQSSVFNQEDNESLVSSVSTVSTLSDDQADSGYGRQRHNYEELIAPPPPGFGDSNSNQGYDTIPSVIPPPPSFGEEKRDLMNKSRQVTKPFGSKSVDNWQCLDVLDWLDSLKLSQYKTSFQQKCIDGKRLQNLTRNDYLDLGVTQVGHRMNLERSIKKLNLPKNVVSSSHL